jgi:predicted O-methyltransferase YrrM
LEKYGSRAVILNGWSVEVAKTIPDGSLDFVFIDANHAYEYVVADIAAWAPKVRKGGIVYGHDFDDYQNYKNHSYSINVINAVTGWVNSNKIRPWYILTNTNGDKSRHCWLYIKP